MLCSVIKPNSFPEIIFAHSLTKKNYESKFNPSNANIEITYIKSGAIKLIIQNREIIAEEGSFIVIPHNYPFSIQTLRNELHIHYTVAFDINAEAILQPELRATDFKLSDTIVVPVLTPMCCKTAKYLDMLNDIIKTYHSADIACRLKAGCMAVDLLCTLSKLVYTDSLANINAPYQCQKVYSDRIKNYIHQHLASDISLADISEVIGKSPNYLNHIFNKINGITIRQYINLERTKKAAELIMKKHFSLKQAADQVGIHDSNYLSRMFKKQFGVSVSEYKNNSLDSTYSMIDLNKINTEYSEISKLID